MSAWLVYLECMGKIKEISDIHTFGTINQGRHQIGTIEPCGDDCRTTKGRYLKILEFTHFTDFFSFESDGQNGKKKVQIRKITVEVVLNVGCAGTKNPDDESK